jgi:hypothetical protein
VSTDVIAPATAVRHAHRRPRPWWHYAVAAELAIAIPVAAFALWVLAVAVVTYLGWFS